MGKVWCQKTHLCAKYLQWKKSNPPFSIENPRAIGNCLKTCFCDQCIIQNAISYGKFPLVKCYFLWKISTGKMLIPMESSPGKMPHHKERFHW